LFVSWPRIFIIVLRAWATHQPNLLSNYKIKYVWSFQTRRNVEKAKLKLLASVSTGKVWGVDAGWS
jgi:hypothetical protein